MEGLAAILTGPFWGKWADRSSRAVLRSSMMLVAILLATVVTYASMAGGDLANQIFFPVLLFLLGAAHAGVRVGRKTYLVNMAEGNERSDYVSVGNTLIGVLLIVAGILTGLASLISVSVAFAIFAVCALAGALYGKRLPSVSQ